MVVHLTSSFCLPLVSVQASNCPWITMATKQPPPLMKKHSQTDLVSRLKTRKILGVGGEDDDGEVHRSKVSSWLIFGLFIWGWEGIKSRWWDSESEQICNVLVWIESKIKHSNFRPKASYSTTHPLLYKVTQDVWCSASRQTRCCWMCQEYNVLIKQFQYLRTHSMEESKHTLLFLITGKYHVMWTERKVYSFPQLHSSARAC